MTKPTLTMESTGYFAQSNPYCPDHLDQDSGDFVSGKGLTFVKDYLEGRLDIAFIFANTNIAAVCKAVSAVSGEIVGEPSTLMYRDVDALAATDARQHRGKFNGRHTGARCGRDDELMFVRNVQHMQTTEPFIPASVRFQRLDLSNDLFSGQLGFSTLHCVYKSVLPLGEGKLDTLWADGFVSDHRKNQQIEGTAKIMDRISDDQPEVSWEGYHLFDEVDRSVGFGLSSGHQAQRFLAEIGFNLPVQIIDMVLCPFDL